MYLNALEEEGHTIAHGATPVDEKNKIVPDTIEARRNGEPAVVLPQGHRPHRRLDLPDVLRRDEHDPVREQRRRQPCAHGFEHAEAGDAGPHPRGAARRYRHRDPCSQDTGRLVLAEEAGTVAYVDAKKIIVENKAKRHEYKLQQLTQTNQNSAFMQRPSVFTGDKVKKGDVLADCSSSDHGQMALGQNARVAFMSWNGANYEDAIIVSERMVQDSKFTTVHIEDFDCAVRDTKLGPEVTTHDIPNVGEMASRTSTRKASFRIGAEVRPGDILVGKGHAEGRDAAHA